MLLSGTYVIRLTAETGQGSASDHIGVGLTRNMKVGLFTLAFDDLDVPIFGLPIQIDRTYDSRDKSVGDFGVGWHLSLLDLRIEKTGNIGTNWVQPNMAPVGALYNDFVLHPIKAAQISVTFPSGKVYRFQAQVQPDDVNDPGDFVSMGTIAFAPMLSASDRRATPRCAADR